MEGMDHEEVSLSGQGSSEENTSGLKFDSCAGQAEKLSSGLKSSGNDETVGEASQCMQFPPINSEPGAEDCLHQTVNGDNQGLIRLYKPRRLAQLELKQSQKSPVSTYKKRRRWLCERLGLTARGKRESNFLNLTKEEMQGYFHYQYINASNHRVLFLDVLDNTFYNPFESLKYSVKYSTNLCDPLKHDLDKAKFEALVNGEQFSKDLQTRKTLDASMWYCPKFRSTIWGHLNADEEDGSQVIVKDLEKWHSHEVLYNTKFDDSKPFEEAPSRGKHIVPNQGKGWSFRERHEGKGKVYGLPCMTQPRLQLYYTRETSS